MQPLQIHALKRYQTGPKFALAQMYLGKSTLYNVTNSYDFILSIARAGVLFTAQALGVKTLCNNFR